MRLQRYELGCDFDDAMDALEFWRGRRERLPWRCRAARREADQMVANWERRLRSAVLRDPSLTLVDRLDGGLLVARTRGSIAVRRWKRRAQVAAVGTAGAAGAAIAVIAGLF